MNNIVDKLESKIKDYKKEKDYKFIANQEKKVFIITNKELKEACWEILYQNLPAFNFREENFLPISFKTEGKKDELTIQIGETTEEKKEREEKKKELEAIREKHKEIRKSHEKIAKEHEERVKEQEEIIRQSGEIQREAEAKTKENQELQQTNQSISSNSQSQIINILPWIIGGTVILIGMLFVYLFTKKENK